MPNGINREAFVRAWSSGDSQERGGMLYDLFDDTRTEAAEARQNASKVNRQLTYLWGGIAVISIIAAPIVLKILGVIPH